MGKCKAIIPSIFTMGNMILGFFSILFSAQYDPNIGNHQTLVIAGLLIFVGAIFDSCDGAVARALEVVSEIGMQLDSFADAVAYGLAPGVLAYQAYLYQLPELYIIPSGFLIAAVFPVCAVYRLARFNCEDTGDGFKGLPSPPAGIIVAIVPALSHTDILFAGEVYYTVNVYGYIAFYILIAFLMVSTIDYSKLFAIIWRKGIAARLITFFVILFLLIAFKAWSIFIVTGIYVFFGILKHFYKLATGLAGK